MISHRPGIQKARLHRSLGECPFRLGKFQGCKGYRVSPVELVEPKFAPRTAEIASHNTAHSTANE